MPKFTLFPFVKSLYHRGFCATGSLYFILFFAVDRNSYPLFGF